MKVFFFFLLFVFINKAFEHKYIARSGPLKHYFWYRTNIPRYLTFVHIRLDYTTFPISNTTIVWLYTNNRHIYIRKSGSIFINYNNDTEFISVNIKDEQDLYISTALTIIYY